MKKIITLALWQLREVPTLLLCDQEQLLEIVFRRGLVPLLYTASFAAVQNAIRPRDPGYGYRRHRAAAGSCPVARAHVDMAAIQAARAMVCVAVSCDLQTAVQAFEIFNLALKTATHAAILLHA
jgi:hypothetical protein